MADIVPDAPRIRLKAVDSLGSGGMKPAYPETLVNRVLDYPYDVTIRISGAITGHIDDYKATSTTFGVVKIGSNIQVRGGTIFVQSAVRGEYGVTTPVFDIDPDAIYSEDQYPTVQAVQAHVAHAIQHTRATSSGAGIVQIGNNIKLGDGDDDHAARSWVDEGSPNEKQG